MPNFIQIDASEMVAFDHCRSPAFYTLVDKRYRSMSLKMTYGKRMVYIDKIPKKFREYIDKQLGREVWFKQDKVLVAAALAFKKEFLVKLKADIEATSKSNADILSTVKKL